MQAIQTITKEPKVIIRPELNIEKWPIWLPMQSLKKEKSKRASEVREIVVEKIGGNNTKEVSIVEISANNKYGSLTTEDEKVWYALIKLWEDAGKPVELVFSLRKLAEILGRKWGTTQLEALKNSLHRLSATYFVWTNSYTVRDEKGQDKTLELLRSFTLLVDLEIARQDINNHTTKEACKVRFHRHIDANLRNNYTRPTDLSIILAFKSGITLLVYKHLEWKLYKQESYTRSSKKLFSEDLCLYKENPGEKDDPGNQEYKKASVRKRVLDRVVAELNDNVTIGNSLLKASLQRSKEGDDWLLVAEKSAQLEFGFDKKNNVTTTPSLSSSDLPQNEAMELVHYFLARFASIRREEPQQKEISQAQALLQTHQLSLSRARQFVDYAKEQANDTGFDVRHFGGIVPYLEKWLSHQKQAQQYSNYGSFTPKQCAKCENSSGYIYVIDASGSKKALRCPHNDDILAKRAQEEHFTFKPL